MFKLMIEKSLEGYKAMRGKVAASDAQKALGLAVCTSILSACDSGSSGSSPSQPASLMEGTFVDSVVTGLHYKTETLSGLTDENGIFQYREGETITFSVGNTILGVTQAQELITPFILSGHKALDTESEILRTLQSNQASTFDKALNIATFLQSLDIDSNPENGIDLGNAHQTLTSVNTKALLFTKAPDFNQTPEFQEILNILGINRARTLAEATNHLYSSLNITIYSAQATKRFNLNASSETPEQSYIYDNSGRLVELTVFNPETESEEKKLRYSYDSNGNIINITDSINTQTETWSYNEQNQINTHIRTINNEQTLQHNYNYNSNNQIERFEIIDVDLSSPKITDYSYNSEGKIKTINVDSNGDEISDQTTSYSYHNNRLTAYNYDIDGNEKSDISISYRYNSQGNIESQSTRMSEEAINYSTSRFEYDDNNNPIRYERDDNQDGLPDYIEAYKYNSTNQRIQYQRDNNADGQWDFTAQYFYDVNGNRIRMIEDSDNNGLADKVWESGYETAILDDSWNRIMEVL